MDQQQRICLPIRRCQFNPRRSIRGDTSDISEKYPLEKEMAIHSCIHAWEIPWTEEPHEIQSMELQRVRHD